MRSDDEMYDQIGELDDKYMQLVRVCKDLASRIDEIEKILITKGYTLKKPPQDSDDTCTVM